MRERRQGVGGFLLFVVVVSKKDLEGVVEYEGQGLFGIIGILGSAGN